MLDQALKHSEAERENRAPTIDVLPSIPITTQALPVGTTRAAVQAAKLAAYHNMPINHLLTVRTSGIRLAGGGGIFAGSSMPERVKSFLELHRHWLKYRGIPIAHIWSREYSQHHRDHLHMGFHMPNDDDQSYVDQMSVWMDEEARKERCDDPAVVAVSDDGTWQLKRCLKGGRSGPTTARYLTKAEPNQILTAWGHLKENKSKTDLSKKTGGAGPIIGTTKHAYRWGTSTSLGPKERDRTPEAF